MTSVTNDGITGTRPLSLPLKAFIAICLLALAGSLAYGAYGAFIAPAPAGTVASWNANIQAVRTSDDATSAAILIATLPNGGLSATQAAQLVNTRLLFGSVSPDVMADGKQILVVYAEGESQDEAFTRARAIRRAVEAVLGEWYGR